MDMYFNIPEIMSGNSFNDKKKNLLRMRIWEAILYAVVIVLIIVLAILVTGGK